MLIIITILAGLISSYVSKPITDLTEKAKQMSYGNLSVDFHPTNGAVYREIYELSDTLNYAESELSKADQMQKELIANVSHDFKTPLTMIKAYAAMIQDISGDNPEKRNKHAQIIIDESDRLASLVNDMLDLSKLRAGIDSLKLSLFNLSDCLQTVAGRFGYLIETEGYTFTLDITEDLFVEADKDKIAQVLYNLIGNAVNYTGEDKRVAIRLFAENGVVHFTVKDTGKGISPEEIDEIWERYYRSGETHKRPVKGTGLGLSIVKTILTKHNFKFGVRSEVGKGSTFYVDFPAKNVAEIE
jgi:signal transduction histidine kinase